jgi:hypothetical protein
MPSGAHLLPFPNNRRDEPPLSVRLRTLWRRRRHDRSLAADTNHSAASQELRLRARQLNSKWLGRTRRWWPFPEGGRSKTEPRLAAMRLSRGQRRRSRASCASRGLTRMACAPPVPRPSPAPAPWLVNRGRHSMPALRKTEQSSSASGSVRAT